MNILTRIDEWLKNIFCHPCPNCENWTTENVYYELPFEIKKKFRSKEFDKYLFCCYHCGTWFREK